MKRKEAHIAHLILSFQDGTISSTEKAQLDELILAYPEYAQDLEPITLADATNDNFSDFNLLRQQFENLQIYKVEDGHPYEKLAIGSLEGLLNAEELLLEANLKQDKFYIENKQKYAQTVLLPDEKIVHPGINSLLKTAPVRAFSFKKFVYPISAAAAIFIAVLLLDPFATNSPTSKVTRPLLTAKKPKSITKQQQIYHAAIPGNKQKNANALPALHKSVKHPQDNGKPELRDCVVAIADPTPNALLIAQNALENAPSQPAIHTAPKADQDPSIALNTIQSSSGAFTKEPITMKAFLLQKTNERLFGTAAPSPDIRYQTMARYASETIGLPVRYAVEEGANKDKVVFQLGPISIERNRSKK